MNEGFIIVEAGSDRQSIILALVNSGYEVRQTVTRRVHPELYPGTYLGQHDYTITYKKEEKGGTLHAKI